jgi:hypothetical protein
MEITDREELMAIRGAVIHRITQLELLLVDSLGEVGVFNDPWVRNRINILDDLRNRINRELDS